MNIRATERFLNILILLGIVGLIFVIGYPIYKESLPSEVRIGVDKSFYSLPFYIAKMDTSRNYFGIEKIKPELVEIKGDPVQAMKNGEYDIAVIPWYMLVISPSNDGDTLKALASIEIRSGKVLDALIIPPKSRIKRLTDLNGKRLGFLQRDEFLVNLILQRMSEDIKIPNLNTVPLQPEELATAFEDNKVDALYLLDPYRSYMVYLGNEMFMEGLVSSYIIPSLPYGAIVMRKNFVKTENRLAAIRLKNAVEATLSYIARNPEIGKRYIIAINNWPDLSELIMNIRMPEFQRLAEVNVKSIENLQTELVMRGIGTCGIKPSEFLFAKNDFVR